MENPDNLERLTILVKASKIKAVKLLAVERRASTSKIMRAAVDDYLRGQNPQAAASNVSTSQ